MSSNTPQTKSAENANAAATGPWAQKSDGGGRISWNRLPSLNQFFFLLAFGFGGIGVLSLVGPPLASRTEAAIFPYTGAGKRQTCLSNLETLGRAFALYAQDNEGRFPLVQQPPQAQRRGAPGERRTWVALLQPYASSAGASSSTWAWACPAGSTPENNDSSAYGLNPILAGNRSPRGEDEAPACLLLSDRGALDDLSLLPPVPGWSAAGTTSTRPAKATNIAFRHEEKAAGVFADGHAATLLPEETTSLALWGGPLVVEAGVRRVASRDAPSGGLVQRLRAGDVKGAAQFLGQRRNAAAFTRGTRDLLALWTLNWQTGSGGNAPGYLTSDEVEELGWHLARAQEKVGDGSVRAALDAQTKRRSDAERARVGAAGWQVQSAANGLKVEVPQGWAWSEQDQGRYRTASARSPLPGLWCSVEKGDRTTYTEAIAVDWRASEKRLQAKYGSGYKRVRMENTVLLGRPAGLWEYELEKPGSPRLRKRYVGTADGWNSYVLSVTVPANCFETWRRDLERIIASPSFK